MNCDAVKKLKEKYNDQSVENFVEQFSRDKVRILEWGPIYREWENKAHLQWIEEAFDKLKEIQQKKLFDLQCMWHSNKIELDGILICDDLKEWQRDKLNCPFLPPITLEEMEFFSNIFKAIILITMPFGTGKTGRIMKVLKKLIIPKMKIAISLIGTTFITAAKEQEFI